MTTCSGRRFGRTLKVEEVAATQLVNPGAGPPGAEGFPMGFSSEINQRPHTRSYKDMFFVPKDVLPSQ